MNKKTLISAILFFVILAFGVYILNSKTPGKTGEATENPSGIILFYGEGCPHCANVDKYIETNKVKEKIAFDSKEVFLNQENAREMVAKAKACGLTTDSVGVPFLWDGTNCIVGDVDIINFFKTKTESL